MVKFLVENGACLFAATLSDHETPAEKCEEDEEGFDGCSEYLYSKYLLYSLLRIIGCLRVLNQERLLGYLRVESGTHGSFAYDHSQRVENGVHHFRFHFQTGPVVWFNLTIRGI